MCFSQEASFALAGTLAVGGAYCLRAAARRDRALLPLAAIPAIFAIQQFCEGWVWRGLESGRPATASVAAVAYLFFAVCFWPVWIPFSMLVAERSRRAARFLLAMTVTGLAIGIGLFLPIAIDPGWLVIQVSSHSLHYNIGESPIFGIVPGVIWQVLYVAVVATPLFVSSLQKMVHGGVAVIVSVAASHIFFDHALTSVWCFFAAVLSLYLCVLFFMRSRPRASVR